MESYKRSYHLLCPGPVNVHAEVARALTAYEFCHREEEFCALFESLQTNILRAANLDADSDYSAIVVTGSGTASNEAVLSSAVPEQASVLVLSNGEFGERLARIAQLHHPNTHHLTHPWAESLDLDALRAYLAEHPVDLIAMVHHETSSGMLNPIQAVGEIAREHGARFFVDAVSSFTADPIDLPACNITFMTSSAGKAIGCYPGLSVVIGRHDAFQAIAEHPPRTRYLNLHRYYEFAMERKQTPNTPAVPLFLSLNRAFELALEEGMTRRFERFAALSSYVRARLAQLGVETLLDASHIDCSNSLTSALMPPGVPFESLRLMMRAEGFVMYEGKGPLKGQIFQVSTLGEMSLSVINAFFDALARSLSALGVEMIQSSVSKHSPERLSVA